MDYLYPELPVYNRCPNPQSREEKKRRTHTNTHRVHRRVWSPRRRRSAWSRGGAAAAGEHTASRLPRPVIGGGHSDPLPPYRASVKYGYAVVSSDGPGIYPVITESRAGNDGIGVVVTPGTVACV